MKIKLSARSANLSCARAKTSGGALRVIGANSMFLRVDFMLPLVGLHNLGTVPAGGNGLTRLFSGRANSRATGRGSTSGWRQAPVLAARFFFLQARQLLVDVAEPLGQRQHDRAQPAPVAE